MILKREDVTVIDLRNSYEIEIADLKIYEP